MMTLGQISDRLEIEETLKSYSLALDTPGRDWEQWERCFTPDATCDFTRAGWDMSPTTPYAHVKELFRRSDAERISTQHLLANIVVRCDGDVATARTEAVAIKLARTDSPGILRRVFEAVLYDDTLVRTAAGWRIRHRACTLRWAQSSDVDAASVQSSLWVAASASDGATA